MKDVRLYLAGQRADLGSDPKILFNYKVTETTNPTVVKNSYTKSLTLPGTPNNNAIFGDIWDLSRLQSYGSGDYRGVEFNPLKKASFSLYIDGDVFETGYFKLTEIQKTGNKIEYNVTLYGGLGEFIYNLSYSEAGNKLEFKDLDIVKDEFSGVYDLGFDITKETVKQAWDEIYSYSSPFSIVNFAPCYNGLPDDFDSDHILINESGTGKNRLVNVSNISSYHNWSTGEASREMTEWETRDLRSYLQRPVLNVQALINTCCHPDNNGGYDVELDEHFFNINNPYYEDAWITLPMIKDMMGTSEEESQDITGATFVYRETTNGSMWYEIETDADFSEYNNLSLELAVNMSATTNDSAESLYTSIRYGIDNPSTTSNKYVKDYYNYFSSVLIQLVAYSEIGEVVAASTAYQLTSKMPGRTSPTAADFSSMMDSEVVYIPEWKTLYGRFVKSGSTYTWCDEYGTPQHISFKFPTATAFHTLKLRIQRPYSISFKWTGGGGNYERSASGGMRKLFTKTYEYVNANHPDTWYRDRNSADTTNVFVAENFYAIATRYGGFTSGKHISHERILTLGITPAEFLLSYIKMFGLHIWKDPTEKIIYIADRNTFYDTNKIVNIDDIIDRSQTIKITPQVASAKWYDFSTAQVESEANEQYKAEYGMEFGLHRINTGYDFDSGKTEVYKEKFKGGIQVLESSPYYYRNYGNWPVYCYNGFTLKTFSIAVGSAELTGTEHSVNTKTGLAYSGINATYNTFDLFDKPQFHKAENDASDGSLVLLFLHGEVYPDGVDYWLTDDLEEMVSLNDKTPCWLMTDYETHRDTTTSTVETIALSVTSMPHFSRYWLYESNGYITHTWDFGQTLETYIPDTYLRNMCSIYEMCWDKYIADMYDVNNRKLSCKCVLRENVNSDWLRQFYYFDNSYWRLNEIKEWNPGSEGTTSVEFIKVIDLNDYKLDKLSKAPITEFYLADYVPTYEGETGNTKLKKYTVPGNVSSVTGYIEVQDGGFWTFGDGHGAEYGVKYDDDPNYYSYLYSDLTESGDDTGYGDTAEVFNIGMNTGSAGRTFYLSVRIDGSERLTRNIEIYQPPSEV